MAISGLLLCLPLVATHSDGSIDAGRTDPFVLAKLTAHATRAMDAIEQGIAAIATLVAYGAAEIEDGSIQDDTLKALGRLLAEMGDFSAALALLVAKCRV